MARERRSFTKEFKREIVKLAGQPGASAEWIARDLGISVYLLERWSRDAAAAITALTDDGATVSCQEFKQMQRELGEVKAERDRLKKALRDLTVDSR